jgi:ubiquitin-like-conjugating enzyme ATG10
VFAPWCDALSKSLAEGRPLPLDDLVKTSLFKASSLAGTEATSFGLGWPDTSFPLLSQGDHPTLGTPCWYLHPCETEAAVGEVMREVSEDGWTDEERLVRWLETWFMVVGTVICVAPSNR